MLTDIEIAQKCQSKDIKEIASSLAIDEAYLKQYGNAIAKVDYRLLNKLANNKNGKLILVTAMTPTPLGEGKTTTTIGLADGLQVIGKKAIVALREPSLGPVFGIKGGAAGGGYSQVIPMEDINLHFTGDFHAISAANNLLAAMIDNHIQQGNKLNIDPRRIIWHRVVDMNDRQLRNIVCGLGGKSNGIVREDSFDITVASEIMAILCLANSLTDLKERLAKIVVAYNYNNEPIYCHDIKAQGALATLLKDAIHPNLVQTLQATPAFIHGGPFANIAHGCNSVLATKLALKLGDYVVTEAGFGGDLGAEKFIDIKCRQANIKPDAVVIVATIRALKHHGGVNKENINEENLKAIEIGFANLKQHYENITQVFGLPAVIAINHFPNDHDSEIQLVQKLASGIGAQAILSNCYQQGGQGATELAETVVKLCNQSSSLSYCYELNESIVDKLTKLTTKIYHGSKVELTSSALKQLKQIEKEGHDKLPICVGKTQYSFSDDASKLAAPQDFTLTIKNLKVSNGAGFIVALAGDIMTMPGLPAIPAAENIDINEDGQVTGLF